MGVIVLVGRLHNNIKNSRCYYYYYYYYYYSLLEVFRVLDRSYPLLGEYRPFQFEIIKDIR